MCTHELKKERQNIKSQAQLQQMPTPTGDTSRDTRQSPARKPPDLRCAAI
jgi:hypothetical protein